MLLGILRYIILFLIICLLYAVVRFVYIESVASAQDQYLLIKKE